MPMSESAREVRKTIVAQNMKAAFGDPKVFAGILEQSRASDGTAVEPPAGLSDDVDFSEKRLASGAQLFVLRPKDASAASGVHVLYFHGGGFVMEIGEPHWGFAARLVRELGCEVSVPIYPLAPCHGCAETYAVAFEAYARAIELARDRALVTAGDSAGGNLAVAVAQHALASGLRAPDAVVGLSPWADVAGAIPGKAERDADDLLLSEYGTREIVRLWAPKEAAAGENPPCVLNGGFEGFPRTLVFAGGDEMLLLDARALVSAVRGAGGRAELVVGEGLWHTYPLFPGMDESEDAFSRISALVKDFGR